jgi:hypothetical protein
MTGDVDGVGRAGWEKGSKGTCQCRCVGRVNADGSRNLCKLDSGAKDEVRLISLEPGRRIQTDFQCLSMVCQMRLRTHKPQV